MDDNNKAQDENVKTSLTTSTYDPLSAVQVKEGELIIEPKTDALVEELSKGKGRKYKRFVMAALGSIGTELGRRQGQITLPLLL